MMSDLNRLLTVKCALRKIFTKILNGIKHNFKLLCVILLLIFCIAFYAKNKHSDLACHGLESNDALPVADDETFPEKSIFFHESSSKGGLDPRQACAVESAAKTNPGWQINVLFSEPLRKPLCKDKTLLTLRKLNNIKIARIHNAKYSKGTPAGKFISNTNLKNDKFGILTTSDALRYITLYKHGGIYLDTDVITVKSYDKFPKNWLAKESLKFVAAGAVGMSKDPIGKKFLNLTLSKLRYEYKKNTRGCLGPHMITRIAADICNVTNVEDISDGNCHGLEVFNSTIFYPIHYPYYELYFKPYEDFKTQESFKKLNPQFTKAHAHHFWNDLSHKTEVQKDSLLDRLARQFCPSIYDIYGDFAF